MRGFFVYKERRVLFDVDIVLGLRFEIFLCLIDLFFV